MDLSFEWDPKKAASNRKKHRVAFEEAAGAFGDPLARIFDDPDHSGSSETREILVGRDARRRLLVVCFIQQSDRVRIFSARRATRQERQDYEDGTSEA